MRRLLTMAALAFTLAAWGCASGSEKGGARYTPVERHMLVVLFPKHAAGDACTAQVPDTFHVTETDTFVVDVLNLCPTGQDVKVVWTGGAPTRTDISGKARADETALTSLPTAAIDKDAADHSSSTPRSKPWSFRVVITGHAGPDPDIVVDPVV